MPNVQPTKRASLRRWSRPMRLRLGESLVVPRTVGALQSTVMSTGAAACSSAETQRRVGWSVLVPRRWGISTRSAVMSASVVLVALMVAVAGLLAILYRTLLVGVDDASSARVRDIVTALQTDTPAELDYDLLQTDVRVVAVQVINAQGIVVRRSDTAPASPLLPPTNFGADMTVGLSDDLSA